MDDKELDDFFRNKSENTDIPYREEDWEKLRTKLDSPPPPGVNGSGRGNKGWWISLLVLVIISGAGIGWKYVASGTENPKTTAIPLLTDVTLDINKIKTQDQWNKIDEVYNSPTADSSLTKATLSTSDPTSQRVAIPTRNEKNIADKKKYINPEVGAVDFSNSRNNIPIRVERLRIVPIELNQQINPVRQLDPMPDKKAQQIRKPLSEKTANEVPFSVSRTNKNTLKGSRFFTTLTLAPDVSALKIKDIQGLGNSVGMNLEYSIHPNISINAGAMYVFKTYTAGEGYSTGYVPAPSHITGDCWVLDLPLNIRYYAINQGLGRWYMSAGLSSYLMLKEKYNLEYTSYNYGGSAYDNTLEIKNKNRHYFNIVNLGIGYERVLTNKLSLQVEPYLKLPLKGIGEGDITLKSAGAFVGLKYGW